jgi:catechol 2,3-dioxygenase-like lactoylglutathione lyase family enzyme
MTMLHHTGLTISDLNRSLRFWRDAMGMQVLFQQEKKGGYLEAIVGEPGAHVRNAQLPVYLLAVREVVLGLHRIIDLTLTPGHVIHRYRAA